MLETLTRGFGSARERLSGVRRLDEENVGEALRDVRTSLLEADVDYQVVKGFLARVKERALGEKVETRARDAQGRTHKVTPGQHFVAICEEELAALMGPVEPELRPGADGRVSVMLVGLQGVGKTTVAAKLARHLESEGKRPLLVAADLQRPAAVEQLQQLGERIGVAVHAGAPGEDPVAVCAAAEARARSEGFDAIVYDTAGRLAVDEALMRELGRIADGVSPAHTLLVCDALMGRDAVNVASTFAERLALDGLVLTKLDGDARGGAALAAKQVTGVPIRFVGTGEGLEQLEPFRPEGLASRILGMGDVVGLVRDFEKVVDERSAEEDAERMLGGQFGMDDLLKQLRTIQRMGPLKDVLGKLPGMGSMAEQVDEREIRKVEAMIQSMTREERAVPDRIEKSRAARIAHGSGRTPREVQELVGRFGQMRSMMGRLGSGGGGDPMAGLLGGEGGGAGAALDPSALLEGSGGGNRKSRRAQSRQKDRQKKKRKAARRARRKARRR